MEIFPFQHYHPNNNTPPPNPTIVSWFSFTLLPSACLSLSETWDDYDRYNKMNKISCRFFLIVFLGKKHLLFVDYLNQIHTPSLISYTTTSLLHHPHGPKLGIHTNLEGISFPSSTSFYGDSKTSGRRALHVSRGRQMENFMCTYW